MQAPYIIRSDHLRNENRRRLLDTLRANGPCSPSSLCQLTGLSPASISTLSSQLIDQGILLSGKHSCTEAKTQRGRPRSQLSLNGAAGQVLTISLTIDQIRTKLIDYAGNTCASHELALDTRELKSESLIATLCRCIDEIHSQHATTQLHHIGVAFQGQTEHESGTLLSSPIIGERHVPLGQALRQRYDIDVSVHNDCRLIAQALKHNHNTELGDTFAAVLFAHGIGLGMYLNGQPFAGTRSSALEIGHLQFEHKGALCRCGKQGCIEAYAADYGIARLALGHSIQEVPPGRVDEQSINSLIDAAQSGERAAIQAFTIAGAAVGEGLVNLFTLLDPMPVALIGHSDSAFELIRPGIHSVLRTCFGSSIDPTALLHCFNSDTILLDQGLTMNSLSQVDHLRAKQQTMSFCE